MGAAPSLELLELSELLELLELSEPLELLGLLDEELLGAPELDGGAPDDDGGVELGADGGWGVVGLLALGQPVSSQQAQAIPVHVTAGRMNALYCGILLGADFIRMGHFLGHDRVHRFKPRTKWGRTQFAHEFDARTLIFLFHIES